MSGDRLHGALGDGKEMVPGVLRGYRYFEISMGLLTSVSFSHVWKDDSWHSAMCPYYMVVRAESLDCSICAEEILNSKVSKVGTPIDNIVTTNCTHHQKSRLGNPKHEAWGPLYGLLQKRISIRVEAVKYHKDVPNLSCSCGFYASYTYDHLQLARSKGTVYKGILGVVEASGKIVLGTRGFRAEKMRIVALFGDNKISQVVNDKVPIYRHEYTMLEKHPPDDVSHLVEVEPSIPVDQLKVEPNRLTSANKHYKRFAANYLNGNWNVGKNVGKSYHVPPNSTTPIAYDTAKLWQDLMNIMKDDV